MCLHFPITIETFQFYYTESPLSYLCFKLFHLGHRRKLGPDVFFLKRCNLACFSNTTQICSCNSLWEMPVCCLTSKKDSSLYLFSNDVIGLTTSKCLDETICHLDPWLCAPPCDKILGGIWDFLLLEQLPKDPHALLQHLLVIHGPEGCNCLPCDHRHQYTLLLLQAHGEKHKTVAIKAQFHTQGPYSPKLNFIVSHCSLSSMPIHFHAHYSSPYLHTHTTVPCWKEVNTHEIKCQIKGSLIWL